MCQSIFTSELLITYQLTTCILHFADYMLVRCFVFDDLNLFLLWMLTEFDASAS